MNRAGSPSPSSRTPLVVAFGIVVLGLALVDVLVLLAVEPQLERLRDIANDHARAVQTTTQIRARIATARGAVLAAMAAGEVGQARGSASGAPEFAGLASEADELLPLAETPGQRADVAALAAALRRCADEALRVEGLLAAGDLPGARRRGEPFVELTRAANETADQIVTFHAGRVEQLSRKMRASLKWTVLAATLLTVVGGASAVILLRRALRGLAAEQAVRDARSAELEAFAARAAHELRTPLQAVSLALRALEAGPSPRALERARRGSERLRDTVDGLLDFARAGVAASDPGAAELADVVADVQEELAPELSTASVSLEVDVPHGTAVAMAPSHLATVVRNLVANAVRYGAGEAGARVAVRARPADGRVRVEVADDGPGIPADALPRIFEPFVRATAGGGGSGLGLATVRRLVEAHGGAVRISSAPGHGTTVALELPGAPGVEREAPRGGDAVARAESPPARARPQ